MPLQLYLSWGHNQCDASLKDNEFNSDLTEQWIYQFELVILEIKNKLNHLKKKKKKLVFRHLIESPNARVNTVTQIKHTC